MISLVPLYSLRPAPYNPRTLDEDRLELVCLSLRKLGFLLPLAATPDGEILSGHRRHTAAERMGLTQVPVMYVCVPPERLRGLNILFNRATNDIPVTLDESGLRDAVRRADAATLAAELPDIPLDGSAMYPCLQACDEDVTTLALANIDAFRRHACNVGTMLRKMGVTLPVVKDETGQIVNGIGRLEAAARKGDTTIPVVKIEQVKARFARAMLNLLSMDFTFQGSNADALRCGAFRRSRQRRKALGTGFVFPVFRRRNRDFDLTNPSHRDRWRQTCGNNVVDFGAGHEDEAAMLRAVGIRVTTFEPYPALRGLPQRKAGGASALRFLQEVRKGTAFTAVFLSSVLNSVPFPEDRQHVVRICAALCGPDTRLFAAARGTHCPNWRSLENGEILSRKGGEIRQFKLAQEPGIAIGDLSTVPKVQKFHSPQEFKALFARFFAVVDVGRKATSVTAACRGPLPIRPSELAASLRFEFNLPYPDGSRMALTRQALEAFSLRLGVDLEAA